MKKKTAMPEDDQLDDVTCLAFGTRMFGHGFEHALLLVEKKGGHA